MNLLVFTPCLDYLLFFYLELLFLQQSPIMQNPLRRPRGNSAPQRGQPVFDPNRDAERGGPRGDSDEGIMSQGVRGHFVAMVATCSSRVQYSASADIEQTGEFVGTVMFLYFAFGATQIANNVLPASEPSLDRLLYISLAFGFSLATTAWVFYRVSGGLFNPAVSPSFPISCAMLNG